MATATIMIGATRAVSAKIVFMYRGAWWADVDLDPDSDPVTSADVPSGAALLTITPSVAGAAPIVLKGTVVPQEGGRFVSSVKVTMLGGGAGWSLPVPAQHFNQPAGLSSATVEQATAALVGEVVVDNAPASLGTDWVREAGPASSVFGDRQWYVDPSGLTQVQAWPPATPDPSVEFLSWDPIQQRGDLSADALVLPGTVLTDPRFDGPITVRDVEMTFAKEGVRASVWCSSVAATRLVSTLTQMVRVLGNLAPLKIYQYRVVTVSGATWTLQPVPNADGSASAEPPIVNVKVWPGMFGLSCMPPLSAHVGVMFLDGNRGAPAIVTFDGTVPPAVTLDATGTVRVGPSATSVALAGGGPAVGRVGDQVTVEFTAAAAAGIYAAALGSPCALVSGTFPLTGTITSGSAKVVSG